MFPVNYCTFEMVYIMCLREALSGLVTLTGIFPRLFLIHLTSSGFSLNNNLNMSYLSSNSEGEIKHLSTLLGVNC